MKRRGFLTVGLVLLLGVAIVRAAPVALPAIQGGAPTVVSYQGEVHVGGVPYEGTGHFKFAIVDAGGTTSYWSNDGTSTAGDEPVADVPLAVEGGIFGLLLGEPGPGMSAPLTASAFAAPDRYLRVWFSSDGGAFAPLTPDTRIAAAPYALQAQHAASVPWDGISGAPKLQEKIAHVVIVAKSGGDFTSVQDAIDSIKSATSSAPWLVWIAPGQYDEQVTMKPHVHLQGAGREATLIAGVVSNASAPPAAATLTLASDAGLYDLKVINGTTKGNGAALLAPAGTSSATVSRVAAWVRGTATGNYAIVLKGTGTAVALHEVTAVAENATDDNYGLHVSTGAKAALRGGSYTARGGERSRGIYALHSDTVVDASAVNALAEGASSENEGVRIVGPTVTLRTATCTGRAGRDASGIAVLSGDLVARGTAALGEDGSRNSYGLLNDQGTVTLTGGTMTARNAVTDTAGIQNGIPGTTSAASLAAEGVVVLGESSGIVTVGLYNCSGAAATVRGGSVAARGGYWSAYGILNEDSGTTLDAHEVSVLSEEGNSSDALRNEGGAAAALYGGSYVARNGISSSEGIHNRDADSIVEATNITAMGLDSGNVNTGLFSGYDASAVVHGGNAYGRGGSQASGLYVFSYGTLEAYGITAKGEGGSYASRGLWASSYCDVAVADGVLEAVGTIRVRWLDAGTGPTVHVSNARLIGDSSLSGTITCVAVSHGDVFYETSCP